MITGQTIAIVVEEQRKRELWEWLFNERSGHRLLCNEAIAPLAFYSASSSLALPKNMFFVNP